MYSCGIALNEKLRNSESPKTLALAVLVTLALRSTRFEEGHLDIFSNTYCTDVMKLHNCR